MKKTFLMLMTAGVALFSAFAGPGDQEPKYKVVSVTPSSVVFSPLSAEDTCQVEVVISSAEKDVAKSVAITIGNTDVATVALGTVTSSGNLYTFPLTVTKVGEGSTQITCTAGKDKDAVTGTIGVTVASEFPIVTTVLLSTMDTVTNYVSLGEDVTNPKIRIESGAQNLKIGGLTTTDGKTYSFEVTPLNLDYTRATVIVSGEMDGVETDLYQYNFKLYLPDAQNVWAPAGVTLCVGDRLELNLEADDGSVVIGGTYSRDATPVPLGGVATNVCDWFSASNVNGKVTIEGLAYGAAQLRFTVGGNTYAYSVAVEKERIVDFGGFKVARSFSHEIGNGSTKPEDATKTTFGVESYDAAAVEVEIPESTSGGGGGKPGGAGGAGGGGGSISVPVYIRGKALIDDDYTWVVVTNGLSDVFNYRAKILAQERYIEELVVGTNTTELVQTPVIGSAALWNCSVVDGDHVVAASIVDTDAVTGTFVKLEGLAVDDDLEWAKVEVRSGSATPGEGDLRLVIWVHTIALVTDISKTVISASQTDKNDQSNAMIRIYSHVLAGQNQAKCNNVLYLGTRCFHHGLYESTIIDSINAVAEVANIDWYSFNGVTDLQFGDRSGSLTMGETLVGRFPDTQAGNHAAFNGFCQTLLNIIDSPALSNKYQWVILEFDGDALYDNKTSAALSEDDLKRIQAWLKPFYDADQVIWELPSGSVVDYSCSSDNMAYLLNYKGYDNPNNKVGYGDADSLSNYLRDTLRLKIFNYRLIDNVVKTGLAIRGGRLYRSSVKIAEDGDWSNCDSNWVANAENNWGADSDVFTIYPEDNLVTARVDKVQIEFWTKLEIDVCDVDGEFRKTAVYHDDPNDPMYGKYTANPNDGPVRASLSQIIEEGEGGEIRVEAVAEAETETAIEWEFEPTAVVVSANDTNMVYGAERPVPSWTGGEGLEEGDFLDVRLAYTNGTWNVGVYPEAIVTNALVAVTNAAGADVSGKYAIEFVPGTLTITPAPIEPKDPADEPPADPTPEDPGENDPPVDPAVPTLWAPNVAKYYDGVGTNTAACVFGAEDGYVFTYEYTTNRDDAVWSETLQFTNVLRDASGEVTSYKVYCRAKDAAGNYIPTNCFAWVTILPRPIDDEFPDSAAVHAVDTNMVYGTSPAPTPTWDADVDHGLVAGDFLVVSLAYTNAGASATWPVGIYPGAIETNALIAVTNAAGEDVTFNYAIAFSNATLTVTAGEMGFLAKDAEKEYDGIATNIEITAVTNAVTGAAISGYAVSNSYDGVTWYAMSDFPGYVNATNDAEVLIKIVADGFSPATGTATVTVTPKAAKITTGTKTDFVYDGEPHAYTNLTAEGFIAGEGLATTTDWATVTAVGEGTNDNTVAYTLADNTLASNYTITVVTGEIAVVAAPIGTPDEPTNPDDPISGPPAEDDGVTLWATNVVKVYDGLGTNIVALVYNAPAGNEFKYEYSTNGTDWAADDDHVTFTNVLRKADGTVDSYKVFYRAVPQGDTPNYIGTNCYAFVTILPKVVSAENGVIADPTNKVYGADAPDLANHTWTGPADGELAAGDGIASVEFAWTNDVAAVKALDIGEYADIITTNDAVAVAIVITNATGDVTGNYVMGFTPGKLTVTDALLAVESEDAEKVYDGIATNIVIKGVKDAASGSTVTGYSVFFRTVGDTAWIAYEDPANWPYVNVWDSTNVEYKVELVNYETFYGTNTVTITKKPLKEPTGESMGVVADPTNMVYGTTAPAASALTYQGPNGLVEGDSAAVTLCYTNANPSALNVGDYAGMISTNALVTVTNATGDDVTGNYDIAFFPGVFTVTKAPIETPEPEKPTDPKPDDPQTPPAETDGPTIWAPDVTKIYDGIGTNTLAQVYNTPEGNVFTIEYSTNQTDWTESLLFTNVLYTAGEVDSYKVYYRVAESVNYFAATNFAWVTILPLPLTNSVPGQADTGVVADPTNKVYGAAAPDLTNHTWQNPAGLVAGDGIASVAMTWTNGSVVATLPVGEYAGIITTNGANAIVITNATGDVTGNYIMGFIPGRLTVTPDRGFVVPIEDDPDNRIYKGEGWEPEVSVTNTVGETLVEDVDYTTEYFDNTNATEEAYVVVTFTGNYEGVVTNYFTIYPKAAKITTGTKTDFVYDGEPHAYTNLTAEGFIAGEGLATTTDWATVTAVGEGTNDNTVVCTLADNTLASNYTITVVTGEIAVVAAPIGTPDEPTNPDDPISGPPAEDDGVTLWATNVVKVYDGLGTNIVALVYNAPAGNEFKYEYSTNGTDWAADDDHVTFTNVLRKADGTVDSYKVFYRAVPQGDTPNYIGTNCYAFVTILPATIWIGEDAPGVEQPDDPSAPLDPETEDTGVDSVFTEWFEGISTNITVTVQTPVEGATVRYSTNGVDWVETLAFTDVVISNKVWYSVEADNFVPVTNYSYVTIWKVEKERKGDVPMDEEDVRQLEEDLKQITDENDPAEHPFIKVQLTIDETNNLDNANTWIGPEDARRQAEEIVARCGSPVALTHFYDIVLERTYDLGIAQNLQRAEHNYNNSNRWENAGWDDIGDGTAKILTIALTPFTAEEMIGKELIGVFRHHGGEVQSIPEGEDNAVDGEYYEVKGLKVILHVKRFSIYGFLLRSTKTAPEFAAETAWGFNPNTGIYFAQLKVTCLNTTDAFEFVPGSMRFDFQDRVEDGVLKFGLWDARRNQALSALGQVETVSDVTYSKFALTDPDPSAMNGGWAPGASKTFGPADLSAAVYTSAERLSTPQMRVNARLNPSLFGVQTYLAFDWIDAEGVRRTSIVPVRDFGVAAAPAPVSAPVAEPEAPVSAPAVVPVAAPAPARALGELTAVDKKSAKAYKGNYFGFVFAGEGGAAIAAEVTWKIAATGKATGTVLSNGVKTKLTGKLYSDADGNIVLDTDAKSKIQLRIVRYAGETVWTGDLNGGVLYGRFTDKKALKSWKRNDKADVFVADGSVVATMTAKVSAAGKATVKTKLPSRTTISGSGQILVLDAAFVTENLPWWSDGTDRAFMYLSKKVKKQVVEGTIVFGAAGLVDGEFVYDGTAYGVSGK